MNYAVEIENICKSFNQTKALSEINLKVGKGEMIGLIGPSGSGKSTLLRHISGLIKSDKNDSSIKVFDSVIQSNGVVKNNIRKLRSNIGFIFQRFNLIERLSVFKNVLVGNLSRMPLWRCVLQIFTKEEKLKAYEALKRVNMEDCIYKKAAYLSGGQQQRVAIARAIEQKAKIILADEPIASLDPESSRKVMRFLHKLNSEDNVTVIVSLHQVDYALRYCKRIVGLQNGKIIFDGTPNELTNEKLYEIYGAKFSETGIVEDFDDTNFDSKNSNKILAKVKAMI